MRTKFVACKDRRTAKRRCPWAAKIVQRDGGFQAYESVEDWRIAQHQK